MNTLVLKSALSLFGPKAIRAAITYLVALFATWHISVDTNSLYTFLASVLVGVGVLVWSIIAKAEPDDTVKDKLGDLAHALVSMAVPAILGILRAKGISLTGSENLEEIGLIGLQVFSSSLNKPDVKALKPVSH